MAPFGAGRRAGQQPSGRPGDVTVSQSQCGERPCPSVLAHFSSQGAGHSTCKPTGKGTSRRLDEPAAGERGPRPPASTWRPSRRPRPSPSSIPSALAAVKDGSRASAPRRRTSTARFLATPAPPHSARRGAPAPGSGDGPPLPWQRGRRARRWLRLREARAPAPAWAAGRRPGFARVPSPARMSGSQGAAGSPSRLLEWRGRKVAWLCLASGPTARFGSPETFQLVSWGRS